MTTITIQPSRISLPLHPDFRPKRIPVRAGKLTRREAQLWIRARITPRLFGGVVVQYRASTMLLRRWLKDPTTPRGVKGHLWTMLCVRRRQR